jgi:hypothetical protein
MNVAVFTKPVAAQPADPLIATSRARLWHSVMFLVNSQINRRDLVPTANHVRPSDV